MDARDATRKLEAWALKELNDAAGLVYGIDKDCRHTGISCGYIGNVWQDGRDDRAWGFFQHPSKMKGVSLSSGERMRGRFPSLDALLDDYGRNRDAYLAWAKGE